MFQNLLGNIFASREANFVSATMFPGWANWETLTEAKCFLFCPGLNCVLNTYIDELLFVSLLALLCRLEGLSVLVCEFSIPAMQRYQ
jgi:hypothetical protein